jgi:hypothetical protein
LVERSVLRGDEIQANLAAQTREHVGNRCASLATGSDGPYLNLRMRRQKPQQFDSGIARATDNANFDHLPVPSIFQFLHGNPRNKKAAKVSSGGLFFAEAN